MKHTLSFLFSFIVLAVFAQSPRTDKLIPITRSSGSSVIKSLEAKFTADVTQGQAPLTVQFTDQSTGTPTSWNWNFGDGDSSFIQNPVHIYQSTGKYTVKLTVSDGTTSFALEKTDYISVRPNYTNCDTLRYPLPEPLTYYIVTNKGYVTGNNDYGDKGIAEYYENAQSNLVITGLLCELSIAKQAAGHNENIPFRVWKADGTSGKPGTLLSSDTVKLSTLVNDVSNSRISVIEFNNPVQPGSSFYAGAMLPSITGDTICFWSTSSARLPLNSTWILQNTDTWESAQNLWTPSGGADFIISSAIYPKICMLIGIDEKAIPLPFAVWPNPAHDFITIVNQLNGKEKSEYSLFDLSGKRLLTGTISGISSSIHISELKPGIYILRITSPESVYSTKLVIR
jgi:PKD repeat protein